MYFLQQNFVYKLQNSCYQQLSLSVFVQQKMSGKFRKINGYKIAENKIGKGSYADVYKCTKISTGQIFAMKIFKQLRQGPQQIKKQVQIVQKLHHPNIIRCQDYFVDEKDSNKLYAVFQYCGKGTLKEYTQGQRDQKLTIDEQLAKSFIWKILDALIYLHERKIAHRDLKLDNILMNDQFEIKLADFGLSKSYEEEDVMATLCGTPLTMAPEVMNREPYSEKCDTWSFGVISYYLLCLEYPYFAKGLGQLKKKIIQQKVPKFPKELQISQQAKDFIKKCLTIQPQKRPSVEELKCHPWFSEVPVSKIRVGKIKEIMGQSSQSVQKTKDFIKNSLKTEIDKIILSTNLFEKRINQIIKGFQQFYPQQKMNLLYFYVFSAHKISQVTRGKITLKIDDQEFQVPNQPILKFQKHMKHLIEFIINKKTNMKDISDQIDVKKCEKSDKILYRFVIFEAQKLVDETEKLSEKKLNFFINLLNFLNTRLEESSIDMKLETNNSQTETIEEIDFFLKKILSVDQILRIVNQDENDIDLGSDIQKQTDSMSRVEFKNTMKVVKDDDVWGMTGEAVERALNVKKLIDFTS